MDNRQWNILVTGLICAEAQRMLEARAKVISVPPYASAQELVKLVKEQKTEGLIVRMGKIGRDVLTASSQLRVIAKHGTGVDNIDVAVATELGLPVLITPYANFESVAEHTVGFIFALSKKLTFFDSQLRVNQSWDKTTYQTEELYHKSIGIIGLGRIGMRVVQLLSPLEMKILGYDPYISEEEFPKEVQRLAALKELLSTADIVSIHCPLTKETYHLLGEPELKMMKPNAYLINTARGKIIDEKALIEALDEGIIAGVALDTFEEEPPSMDSPLFKLDNVITTPHIAGVSQESFIRMGITATEMVFKVLEGKINEIDLHAIVNPTVVK
jgi:D-3-phosphoglycerate dehydrogenase